MRDLRQALRLLLRHPGFAALAVISLAAGIAANTVVFSLVRAFLLQPLPFARPAELVHVWQTEPKRAIQELRVSEANFLDWKRQATVFDDLGAYYYSDLSVRLGDEAIGVRVARVTPNLFPLLGVQPARGRWFTAAESREKLALASHGFYQSRLDAGHDVLGQTLTLDGEPYRLIGVMPAGFHFPMPSIRLWVPLALTGDPRGRGEAGPLLAVGRLKAGRTLAAAQAEMGVASRRLADAFPEANRERGVRVVPLREALVFFFRELRGALLMVNLAAAFVLLIVCANLGNLLLVRAVGRQHEMALRLSLGASRGRLVRQLLLESGVTASAGALLGVALSALAAGAVARVLPEDLFRAADPGIDGGVLLFALAVSLGSVLAFALTPALEATRKDPRQALQEGVRGSTDSVRSRRLRTALASGQIALAGILLAGAHFSIQTFREMGRAEAGFSRAEAVLTFKVSPPRGRELDLFYNDYRARLRALPAAEHVAAVLPLPLDFQLHLQEFSAGEPPKPGEKPTAARFNVTPGYFTAIGIPLLEGRDFNELDTREKPRVVVVNRTLASTWFAGMSPLGREIRLLEPGGRWLAAQIVGVAGDTKDFLLHEATRPQIYVAQSQAPTAVRFVVLKAAAPPLSMVPAARAELAALDRGVSFSEPRTMQEVARQTLVPVGASSAALSGLGLAALLLATLGVYGVIAYAAGQRTREIGIRLALGAAQADIRRLVVRQGLAWIAAGVAVGLAAVIALTRLAAGAGPGWLLAGPVAMGAVAVAAAYLPARRAAALDPMTALRYQ